MLDLTETGLGDIRFWYAQPVAELSEWIALINERVKRRNEQLKAAKKH